MASGIRALCHSTWVGPCPSEMPRRTETSQARILSNVAGYGGACLRHLSSSLRGCELEGRTLLTLRLHVVLLRLFYIIRKQYQVRKPLSVVLYKRKHSKQRQRNCHVRKLCVRPAQAPRKLRYHPIDYVRSPTKTTFEHYCAGASTRKLRKG